MSENAFVATLPEEFRSEPSLQTITDVGTLAKGYVNAQKLIGAKRLVAPSDSWGEQQWNEFYDNIGRPKTPDEYKLPEVKFEDGITVDPAKKQATLAHLHKMGLTQRQAAGVMEYYFGALNEAARGMKAEKQAALTAGEQELRQAWGDKFDANLDVARSVIKKFGGDKAQEMMAWLDASGMGNNAKLAQLFHKIGLEFTEDRRRSGGGSDLPLGDQSRAHQEISQLTTDRDFQVALTDANNPGHRAAVDRWINLHSVAYPGKSE